MDDSIVNKTYFDKYLAHAKVGEGSFGQIFRGKENLKRNKFEN